MNLYDIATELFAYLMAFRLRVDAGVKTTLEEVKKDLLQIFREQEIKVRKNSALASAYDQVRYPLVVFADEVILNSNWEYAREWDRELLERRFFESEVGGDRFFDLCEELQIIDPQVAAILYTCLSMGFRGRYEPEAEELRLLKQEMLAKCPPPLKEPEAPLSPEAYTIRERKIHKLPLILRWRQMLILFVILIGINIIIDRLVIWNYVTEPVRDITHLAATRLATGEMPYPFAPGSPKQVKRPEATEAKSLDSPLATSPSSELSNGPPEPEGGQKLRRMIEPYPSTPEAAKETVKEAPSGSIVKERKDLGYSIQLAMYYKREKAEEFVEILKGRGYDPYVVEEVAPSGKTWYLVRMGHYDVGEIKKAREAAAEFSEKENMEVYVTNRTQ